MTFTPGERTDLKKRIAATLGEQPWRDVDLTLEEFGFPTLNEWDGTKENYVLEMLRDTHDSLLQQLDGYLHPSAVRVISPQPVTFDDPTGPWTGSGLRFFLSHSHKQAQKAAGLREELAKRSVDVFVAHDSIEPTDEWEQVILSALKSCDACGALMTPEFVTSKWCDQEMGFCLARDRLIIPLDLGATPYGFIGRFHALPIDGRKIRDVALSIFELLVRKPQSRDAMAQALVDRWASTTSWDGARENYGFLKTIPEESWTQQLVNEVWEARDRVHDLRTADIGWKSSEAAVERLFEALPFVRPDA
jgi:hypothetical protein